MSKNAAAVELGRLRWKGKSKKQRREYALMMVEARKPAQDKAKKALDKRLS